MFANLQTKSLFLFGYGPENRGSIPGRVIPKTQKKWNLIYSLLNTQHYKLRIKGKTEQSKKKSGALPYTLVLYLLKRGTFRSPTLLCIFFNTPYQT